MRRDVRLSPNSISVYFNDLTVAVGAAKQGVTAGEDTVSGLMIADDFVVSSKDLRRITETNRGGAINRIRWEMEGDGERKEARSICM